MILFVPGKLRLCQASQNVIQRIADGLNYILDAYGNGNCHKKINRLFLIAAISFTFPLNIFTDWRKDISAKKDILVSVSTPPNVSLRLILAKDGCSCGWEWLHLCESDFLGLRPQLCLNVLKSHVAEGCSKFIDGCTVRYISFLEF